MYLYVNIQIKDMIENLWVLDVYDERVGLGWDGAWVCRWADYKRPTIYVCEN